MALQRTNRFQQNTNRTNYSGRDMRAGQMYRQPQQQQSPLMDAASMYGSPEAQIGRNLGKAYNNAIARQSDGVYQGVEINRPDFKGWKANGKELTDKQMYDVAMNNQVDPKLLGQGNFQEQLKMMDQGYQFAPQQTLQNVANPDVFGGQGFHAVTQGGGGTFADSLAAQYGQGALANGVAQGASAVNGGALGASVANGGALAGNAIGAGTEGMLASNIGANVTAQTGGALAGEAIGAGTGAATAGAAAEAATAGATAAETAAAAGTAANPGFWATLGASAPYAIGVYGLGKIFKWW